MIRITCHIRIKINRGLLHSFFTFTIPIFTMMEVIPVLVAIRRRQLIENDFFFGFFDHHWFGFFSTGTT